jgi:hypothetical protein
VPEDFMKDLPFSRRKTKRKGLRIQKEGLRTQKKMRFKMMSKKFADALARGRGEGRYHGQEQEAQDCYGRHRWWSFQDSSAALHTSQNRQFDAAENGSGNHLSIFRWTATVQSAEPDLSWHLQPVRLAHIDSGSGKKKNSKK